MVEEEDMDLKEKGEGGGGVEGCQRGVAVAAASSSGCGQPARSQK